MRRSTARFVLALPAFVALGCTCAVSHAPPDGGGPARDAAENDARASVELGACDDPATWTAPASSGFGARVEPDIHCASGRFDVLVRYVLRVEASRACLRVIASAGGAPAPGTSFEVGTEGLAIRLAAGDAMTYELRYVDARGELVQSHVQELDVEAGAPSVHTAAPLTGLGEGLVAGGTTLWSRGAEAEIGPHDAADRFAGERIMVVHREAAGARLSLFHDGWAGGIRAVEREGELVVDDPGGALRFVPRCGALTVGTELWMLSLESDAEGVFEPRVTQRMALSSPVRDVAAVDAQVGLVLLEDRRVLACVAGREPRDIASLPFVPERLLDGAAIADDTRVARVRLEGDPFDAPVMIVDAPFAMPSEIGAPRALASDGTVIGSIAAGNDLAASHGPTRAMLPAELGVEILATDLEWAAIRGADDRIGLWARGPNDPGCEL